MNSMKRGFYIQAKDLRDREIGIKAGRDYCGSISLTDTFPKSLINSPHPSLDPVPYEGHT